MSVLDGFHFTNASGGIFPAALASANILAAASKFQLKQKWSVNLLVESFLEEISVEPVLHKAFARPLNVHPRLLGEFDSHRLRRIVKSDRDAHQDNLLSGGIKSWGRCRRGACGSGGRAGERSSRAQVGRRAGEGVGRVANS